MTTDVVIAGGGPNGLMLAAELGLAGVHPVVLERRTERSREPKANGIIGQVVRLMDHRGLYERLGGRGGAPRPIPAFVFGALPLDLARLDPNPMYGLGVPQRRLEEVLEERARELGAEIRRGHELLDLAQDEHGVELRVRGPGGTYPLRTAHLVGCDGGHSTVRELAGIGFPGVSDTDVVSRTAYVSIPGAVIEPGGVELRAPGLGRVVVYTWHRTERGAYAILPLPSGDLGVSCMEWGQEPPGDDVPMTIEELRAALRRVLGVDVPLAAPAAPGPHLLRRLSGRNTRVADRYRRGRVLLAGDAAHVHAAVGGPGLNLGLQDVVNLGWKLAALVRGRAPAGLLDTYETERRAAAERVVMHTQAQAALMAPGGAVTALRELFGELLRDDAVLGRVADLMSGADVRYRMDPAADEAAAHPLTGRFSPDLSLVTGGGAVRTAELMRAARPVLLDLAGRADLAEAAAGWKDRVDVVAAECAGAPAEALLIRPDGYVAWAAGQGAPAGPAAESLIRALTTWFGPAGG